MTGGMGGGHSEPAQAPAQPAYQTPQDQYQQGPACQFELKQFIECTQTQSDISLCQGFNEILKNCKLQYGKFLTYFQRKRIFKHVNCIKKLVPKYFFLATFNIIIFHTCFTIFVDINS